MAKSIVRVATLPVGYQIANKDMDMRILVYATPLAPRADVLMNALNGYCASAQFEFLTTLETLIDRLHRPRKTITMAILMPLDGGELAELADMRHLLRDMPVIVILPRRQKTLKADVHLIRPRYIGYSDSDFSDVTGVVRRMIRHLPNFSPGMAAPVANQPWTQTNLS